MKFVLSVLIIFESFFLFIFGSMFVLNRTELASKIKEAIKTRPDQKSILAALNDLLNNLNCYDIVNEDCQNKISEYIYPIFLHFGYLSIIFGIFILVDGIMGVMQYNKIKKEAHDELSGEIAFCCV